MHEAIHMRGRHLERVKIVEDKLSPNLVRDRVPGRSHHHLDKIRDKMM